MLPQPAEEPEDNAPEILPPSVTQLLANSCDIQIKDVDVLWMELWHLIWDEEDFPRHDLAGTILKYGHGLGFVPDMLYSPQHSCIHVRATPKSNSVDKVRALQGDATVLEDAIKL